MENKKDSYFIINAGNNLFLIFRELFENSDDIIYKIKKEIISDNKVLIIIFDIDDLSKKITIDKENYIHGIIQSFEDVKRNNLNIFFKNCLIEQPSHDEDYSKMLFFEDEQLLINKLYISDELYIMSPYLNLLFKSYFAKELILKKIKINSKLQLSNFFNYIARNYECEKLILEDISIELIIKLGKIDNTYNELNQYFYFSKGRILIKKMENSNIKIKKLKLIDCPLFALTDDTFFEIEKYKEISINIDSNSLLNPEIITKFKINGGLIDVCYDLDSYKVNNEDEDKDYLEYIKYIIDLILENINNYRKIKFKNFDITKFEYITGENYTNINEDNWVLNEEEYNKKIKYENFYRELKEKTKDKKFKNMKELIFNNCSINFMELIFSLVNIDLNLLKLKKCAKEFFDLNKISHLNIIHLSLFDIPINFTKEIKYKIKNLTIKINGLEYYCEINNLNYYKTIGKIVEFMSNSYNYRNLCLEMNTLPIVMSFLFSKKFNKKMKLPNKDFIDIEYFKSIYEVNKFIKKEDLFNISGLEDKTIRIIKNNINNSLDIDSYKFENIFNIFNFDIYYLTFFNQNHIRSIIFEDNFINNYLLKKNAKNKSRKIKTDNLSEETLINLMNSGMIKYKIDFKSLSYSILSKDFCCFSFYFKEYIICNNIPDDAELPSEIKNRKNNLKIVLQRIENIFNDCLLDINNKITFIINDIKERKELYILLCIYQWIKEKNNIKIIKEKIYKHFLKGINEKNEEIINKMNYYYLSEEEIEIFGEPGKEKKEIEFEKFEFEIEYSDNNENFFDILFG